MCSVTPIATTDVLCISLKSRSGVNFSLADPLPITSRLTKRYIMPPYHLADPLPLCWVHVSYNIYENNFRMTVKFRKL